GTIRGGCLNAPAFIFLSGHLGLLFLPKAGHAWLSMLLLVPGRLTSKEKSARKEPVCKKIGSRLAGSRLWETPARGNVYPAHTPQSRSGPVPGRDSHRQRAVTY